jgi:carbon monoxide dehydrogenase subunit G
VKVTVPVSTPAGGWDALARPEMLARALPGCRSAERTADGVRIVVDVAVASVRGLWAGTLTEVDVKLWRIVGSGEPGRADLIVSVDDDPTTFATTLTVEGTVEGPLAAIGSALLAAAVRRTVLSLLASDAAHEQRQNEGGRA